jgi:hypothetical protein
LDWLFQSLFPGAIIMRDYYVKWSWRLLEKLTSEEPLSLVSSKEAILLLYKSACNFSPPTLLYNWALLAI